MFKINITEYEDKSVTIDKIYLPNGIIIENNSEQFEQTDLNPMKEFINEEFDMYFNNEFKYKCKLIDVGFFDENIPMFNYDVLS